MDKSKVHKTAEASTPDENSEPTAGSSSLAENTSLAEKSEAIEKRAQAEKSEPVEDSACSSLTNAPYETNSLAENSLLAEKTESVEKFGAPAEKSEVISEISEPVDDTAHSPPTAEQSKAPEPTQSCTYSLPPAQFDNEMPALQRIFNRFFGTLSVRGNHPGYQDYATGRQTQGQQQEEPITSQPGRPPGLAGLGPWMNAPGRSQNCPPGLEYLMVLDQIIIQERLNVLEIVLGFDFSSLFDIKNMWGQNIYFAAETSNCCARACFGHLRPFHMHVMDNFGNEAIHMARPLACDGCCCPLCLQSIVVSAPQGHEIGSVKEECTFCQPKFRVLNSFGDTVLRIVGPICYSKCFKNVIFDVFTENGQLIGKITNKWSNILRENFTNADTYVVSFPLNLDVRMKATLIGATFLIDYMYYENKQVQSE
ncbi:phospholipid scramblase 2-like [Drosophila busckii]|uniref:phospholipid scramblase 2-like n=1 Tax=Drosophila busckii TaxID=30019 RepID=UPI00083EAE46|nr:phospholipid scramblase 2-like [Drosophila busckii]